MRKIFKRCAAFFLIPLTRWYLRKERAYTYQEVRVKVNPGVFHPGFFYSTKFLLDFLSTQLIRNKSLLELGCGSGLISVICAKNGATVTASDLSEQAIENTKANASANNVSITTVNSDIFDNLNQQKFDWIIINPPYYAKDPQSEQELAWNCGKNFEYFKKLFTTLGAHLYPTTNVIMVLTLGSEIEKIEGIANQHGFQFELLMDRDVLFDGKDFIYKITPSQD